MGPIESELDANDSASAPTALISHAVVRSQNRAGKRCFCVVMQRFRMPGPRGYVDARTTAYPRFGYRVRRLRDRGDDKARRPKRIRHVGAGVMSKRAAWAHGGVRSMAYRRCLL